MNTAWACANHYFCGSQYPFACFLFLQMFPQLFPSLTLHDHIYMHTSTSMLENHWGPRWAACQGARFNHKRLPNNEHLVKYRPAARRNKKKRAHGATMWSKPRESCRYRHILTSEHKSDNPQERPQKACRIRT